jgi:hypothetical protein
MATGSAAKVKQDSHFQRRSLNSFVLFKEKGGAGSERGALKRFKI